MKNIYLIPTEKPSSLYIDNKGKYNLEIGQVDFKTFKNIYITNDEKIKEGDWRIYFKDGVIFKIFRYDDETINNKDCKKIILTTDQDLIKDGVQAIPDEFLEWFVQNPSCEFVEVLGIESGGMLLKDKYINYNIIIPKEEPKLTNICIKCGVDLYATEGKFICQKHPKECKGIYLSEEPLLTHAAEQKQHIIDIMKSDEELELYEEPKQERSYSEEEVIDLIQSLSMNEDFNGYGSVSKETAKYFLEQLKKKS